MKRIVLACLALGLSPVLRAEPGPWGGGEVQSVQIEQTVQPVFPREALQLGLRAGRARIAISVGVNGALTDWLIVGYTHRSFADAALTAVRRWHFRPMLLRNEPMPGQLELDFDFKSSGVVVSVDAPNTVEARVVAIRGPDEYWPCTLKELDAIPTPITADPPHYPQNYADYGLAGDVVVQFYIDETGAVRMPALTRADHLELGLLAVDAVRHWRFEPPTRRGHPVLVKAQQVFHFSPASHAAASTP